MQPFNDGWLFIADRVDWDTPDDLFEKITLPHSNQLFSQRSVDNQSYQFISTYRKHFTWASSAQEQVVFLDFDGVMLAATVYLNGVLVGEHLGGFAPFSVDLTAQLAPGVNTLTVHVDSRERTDVPPYGHLVDYLTFGGIYRDVTLRMVSPCHIDNLFVCPQDVLTQPWLAVDVRLHRLEPALALQARLLDQHGAVLAVVAGPATQPTTTLIFPQLPPVALWTLDRPALYTVEVSLTAAGDVVDLACSRFGFRTAEFRAVDGGFYLNGQRLKLFGLNRHQTYPYIGAAAPARLQRQDADILKYELACNVVRTSHYPQSPHFLNRCDEIGLLVFEEIAGWQHIGAEAWKTICLDELRAMIERDRNHPCVIMWGVRINESRDDDGFYTRTNSLARQLDPSRPTGGVRYFLGSSFLEDVYTYNDFSNTVVEPTQQPHLITEFAGHMFPTKTWDCEERLIEHALLHARIHNLQMGNDRVAGAIGWAAFDYNTHIEFGSGDRICHHGVMDIFRLPKWAAHFYASQQSPAQRVVLQAATHWTMGDRSGGGVGTLTVFSNCDEIEVSVGDHCIGKFLPNRAAFPYLPHPPFTVTGLDAYNAWGQGKFYDLQLVGYLDGQPAAQQRLSASRLPRRLTLTSDANALDADGADMTRLVISMTDEFDNVVPYALKVVTLDIAGEADLIGENPFPVVGGQGALYVKARRQPGLAIVTARISGLPAASTTIDLVVSGP
jgi:beta-galactosidase